MSTDSFQELLHYGICASQLLQLAWKAIRVAAPQYLGVHPVFWRSMVCWQIPFRNVYWSDFFRTNNHLEGWHNCLKWLVVKVYKFVEVIRKEQTATMYSWKLEHILLEEPWISRDRKMHKHNEPFDINKIILEEYVLYYCCIIVVMHI